MSFMKEILNYFILEISAKSIFFYKKSCINNSALKKFIHYIIEYLFRTNEKVFISYQSKEFDFQKFNICFNFPEQFSSARQKISFQAVSIDQILRNLKTKA